MHGVYHLGMSTFKKVRLQRLEQRDRGIGPAGERLEARAFARIIIVRYPSGNGLAASKGRNTACFLMERRQGLSAGD